MSYFKAKMHQIRFQLGLCWGNSRSPNWIYGVLLIREGRGKGKERGKIKEGLTEVKGWGILTSQCRNSFRMPE